MNYDEDNNDFEKDLSDADLLDGLGDGESGSDDFEGGEEGGESEE